MGRAAEHFGHDPKEAGKKAAKDIGYGKEFKKGYAEEASK